MSRYCECGSDVLRMVWVSPGHWRKTCLKCRSTGPFAVKFAVPASVTTEKEGERIEASAVRVGDVLNIDYVSPQFGHTTVRREVVALVAGGEIILRADDHGGDYVWKHPERDTIRRAAVPVSVTAEQEADDE